MSEAIVLGGIEGGATHSKVMLFNDKGKKLVECSGPGTNHWTLGVEECQKRIIAMVVEAKREAGLPLDQPLTALCMSLSGCEQEESNNELKDGLLKRHPTLSQQYVVCSDTVGSMAAAHRHGGVVLIAGTGSNALLLNPDDSVFRCGGWGHILGDEGGAWWISHKAIKVYFDEQDNFATPPFDTDYVWHLIKKYFNIKTRFDLLDHCYSKFEKRDFAGLCLSLSQGAHNGDLLCQWLFAEAGRVLARSLVALFPNAHESLVNAPGGLPVLCIGSVWLTWDFLKPGFVAELDKLGAEVTLLRLTTSMAAGAVYLAAKHVGIDIPRDYKNNYQIFFNYKPNQTSNSHS